MDIEKNKPLIPDLDENLKKNHETNGNEGNETRPNVKETIAKNKEIIEKNRKLLRKK